ncbi:MAG: class I SAM-dependent methyltransferase [Rhodospirillaceae bacterium]|jgi:ribosomal protein L11 methylase PrmA|nr:class I SAM-dependent methyltransferase [Rhodospirillaceae bacterium]MBT4043791.1 class I SAM-dependent methyltransferase [Rhodospirillaceae bacterium]MBT4687969.1 class I SAM-dependent methyltransferase [Rhodospirillaceae bacterium]MBT5083530.1 class I SAM-dependent methyltransferase [Rhodospirillaceae bacterium]MBT5526374.1 class I SAM-dependent methyltransferase [Rhodospirillaceae bacterium]
MNNPVAGSFRDPAGHVYDIDGRIIRTIAPEAVEDFRQVMAAPCFQSLIDDGWLIDSNILSAEDCPLDLPDKTMAIEHSRIPFISYPYEWSFAALKSAALLHLDLHIRCMDDNITLCDGSAYNIQFIGPRPVFIDLLSLRPYREGEPWAGYRQFCEQFINPLLLGAKLGIAPNAWYRGALEGITAGDLASMLKWQHRLSWNMFWHVFMQASLQNKATAQSGNSVPKIPHVARAGKIAILKQLRKWIASLSLKSSGISTWGDYAHSHSYDSDAESQKRDFVAAAVKDVTPATLLDLGCNVGDYTVLALESGAGRVLGADADHLALERAFSRAQAEDLDFLPLYLDGANPTPSQGWNGVERDSFTTRAKSDMSLSLAVLHHLVIGRNIPLDQAVPWIVSLAPNGVMEFVTKDDPMITRMLALREDIFPDYTQARFEEILSEHATITASQVVLGGNRVLYRFTARA